jgi:predicted TIM-barrel fold metal-dependent hydrolase
VKPLFEVLPHDRQCYDEHLRDWLPPRLIDVHVHVWLARLQSAAAERMARTVTWPARVAADNAVEDLIATYELLFPGKEVGALTFSLVRPGDDFDTLNAYTADSSRRYPRFASLLFATPAWSGEEFEQRVIAGGFVGAKVYLNHSPAYLPEKELRIFDFLPPHQLDVLDRHGWIVMLHIPRHGRLQDPVNLYQMLELEQRWPNVRVIIAHVGRAYCDGDVGDAFKVLAPTRRLLWDFSANTNATVFRQLLDAVGPRRVLFGSDLPITRMRMRRIQRDGRYVNLVPPGLYGDVSGDPNMGEVTPEEGRRLTFFLYEELLAFKQAATAAGLSRQEVAAVFHDNAAALLAEAGRRAR